MHDLVVRDLGRARDRTLGLTDVDEPTLVAQHDPLMSPLVWDLAHVGQQEQPWLLRGGDQARPGMLPPGADALYDAFKHPAPSARRCRQPSLEPYFRQDRRAEPLPAEPLERTQPARPSKQADRAIR
jgi:iron(II)-dependent oxidoreductase